MCVLMSEMCVHVCRAVCVVEIAPELVAVYHGCDNSSGNSV